jgi:beta-glucanase (GH16 family)
MVSYRWQDGRLPPCGKGDIKPNDWNVYAIEWMPEKITWSVNGKATHVYEKVGDDLKRFLWTCIPSLPALKCRMQFSCR